MSIIRFSCLLIKQGGKDMIEWNTSEMQAIITQLRNEIDSIEKEKQILIKYSNNMEAAFQGNAAKQFLANLKMDINNLQIIIDEINNEIEGIRKVINHYSNCETGIKNMINSVKAEMV